MLSDAYKIYHLLQQTRQSKNRIGTEFNRISGKNSENDKLRMFWGKPVGRQSADRFFGELFFTITEKCSITKEQAQFIWYLLVLDSLWHLLGFIIFDGWNKW